MKPNFRNIVFSVSLFLIQFSAHAQHHPGKITASDKFLPMNRAAFIFCYNKTASYKNPAENLLKISAAKKTTQTPVKNNSENVRMFSNTTEDELWVQLDKHTIQEQELNLEIYNASGQIIYSSKIEQELHKVNVCDFSAGTFLVRLGENVQKLIIE